MPFCVEHDADYRTAGRRHDREAGDSLGKRSNAQMGGEIDHPSFLGARNWMAPSAVNGGRCHAGIVGCANSRNLYLNETAPRWENHSRSASLRPPCFVLVSRHQSLAQTAPLARATNLPIKANPVPPPPGFVQEPVPERPQRLAVKPRHLCRPFVYRLLPFLYQTPVQCR